MGWKMQQEGEDRDNTQTNGPTTSFPDRFLEETAQLIRDLARHTAQNIIEIGRQLAEVKRQLRHGEWEGWVRRELGWHPSTAWRLLRAGRLASTQGFDIGDVWGNRRKKLAIHGQQDVALQQTPAALHPGGEVSVAAALPAGRRSVSTQQPSRSSLPLQEAIQRASSFWRGGKGVPGAVAILSSDAVGEWYLHLVGSSTHVQVGVTEPEVSFPCSHGEYLVAVDRQR